MIHEFDADGESEMEDFNNSDEGYNSPDDNTNRGIFCIYGSLIHAQIIYSGIDFDMDMESPRANSRMSICGNANNIMVGI